MTVINSLTVNAGELGVAWREMWLGAIVSCIVQLFVSKAVGMAEIEFIEIMTVLFLLHNGEFCYFSMEQFMHLPHKVFIFFSLPVFVIANMGLHL